MDKKDEILDEVQDVESEETQEEQEFNKDEYIAKLNDDLNEQKRKADEYFESLKRNMADFDNFKKRMSKEKESLYSTITSDVVLELLPVLDNFEKAMEAECKDEEFKNGMKMIYDQILEVLKKIGVEKIEALNQVFDPNIHEAVMHIEDENYSEKQIVEEFRKGYRIGDKIIRHSMVKVAN